MESGARRAVPNVRECRGQIGVWLGVRVSCAGTVPSQKVSQRQFCDFQPGRGGAGKLSAGVAHLCRAWIGANLAGRRQVFD